MRILTHAFESTAHYMRISEPDSNAQEWRDTHTKRMTLYRLVEELMYAKMPQIKCVALTLICDFDSER